MSADLLRQAADQLDELADAATPGPWEECATRGVDGSIRNSLGIRRDPEAELAQLPYTPDGSCDLAYIAAMSPTVGKALALWLRDVGDRGYLSVADDRARNHALAVARAILGDDQ